MRKRAMRILKTLNILFGVLALLYSAQLIRMHWNRWPGSATRIDWSIFFLLLAISVYMVVHLAYCGIRLIKEVESALMPCFLLFAAESLGVLASIWASWMMLPRSMDKVIFGLWSIALSPIDVQVFSGYSLLGVVATLTLLLVRRSAISKSFARGESETE